MNSEHEKVLDGLKVARVSTVAFFVETQLRSQIQALVQSGAHVTVIASEPHLERPIPAAEYLSVKMPRRISIVHDWVALFRLWRIFRRGQFDIVHSTTPKAGLLCALAGLAARVPVRIHTFTGQPWVEMRGLKRFLAKTSDRLVGLFNTKIYADSASQREFLIRSKIVKPESIAVLGEGSLAGVDLRRFSPARFDRDHKDSLRHELGISGGTQVLLFVGRVVRDKGVRELLEALDRLVSKGLDITLLLVGPEEEPLESIYHRRYSSAHARVVRIGFSDCPEQYMALADLLVIPSYREGFGTVVIEAAAMGLPAVGTRIYGLSDAIVHGETGLLVEPKRVSDLSFAIEKLLVDDQLRSQMGRKARGRAEACFGSEKVNELVVGEYARLSCLSARGVIG